MNSGEILASYGLSKTHCRIDILDALIKNQSALSETELRKKLSFGYDRSTVFRTIRSFIEADIIHPIACSDGIRYALSPGKTNEQHAHFTCSRCGSVSCIAAIQPGRYTMPKGFTSREMSLMISGICKQCNHSK